MTFTLSVELKNKAEVLSPVGSQETLLAAVRSGADAVYLGAQSFSARRNAQNFDDAALKSAVEYCHKYGVRVYLTHNIMLRQSELAAAAELAGLANKIGIDGIIVQDLGLADIIHRAYPDIELHASTQMSLHSPAALGFLKNIGFSRVVAAREMSFKQLKELCAAAAELDMEVEVFVHGALCMSVSGQCLLSSMLGGRSGNRGLCAGPCRLPFSAENGTGHDLSLKDLSLLSHIKELEKIGVRSLKIEGRMKRPEYVAAATAACRSAVDSGVVSEELSAALSGVFSRSGFTDAYFTGKLSRDMFGIRTREDVLRAGDTVNRLHELYRCERQSVPVRLFAKIETGKSAYLSLDDGVNSAEVTGETVAAANNRPITEQMALRALEKLGGTPYYVEKSDISISENAFLPSSALNSLRRDAVALLDEMRAKPPARRSLEYNTSTADVTHFPQPRLVVRVTCEELLPQELSGITPMLPAEAEFTEKSIRAEAIVQAPRWIENEQALLSRFEQLYRLGLRRAYCDNLSSAALALRAGFKVIGGMGLNVCNSLSAQVLGGFGLSAVTLTPEMPLSTSTELPTALPKGIFAYGRLPLMLLRSCPMKNGRSCRECDGQGFLVDRKGVHFPVRCRNGVSELLNSAPHFLADRLKETHGLDFLLLYFTDETPKTVRDIINIYKVGGSLDGAYTRGAYFRDTP